MGMPSKDTVKLADPSGYIKETPTAKLYGIFRLLRYFLMI